MTEVAEREVTTIPIDREAPWANWAMPTIVEAEIAELELEPVGEDLPYGFQLVRALSRDQREPLGLATPVCMKALSERAGFPVDFVRKLSPELMCDVVNERILDARDQTFAVATEPGEAGPEVPVVTNVFPHYRGVVDHRIIAQISHDQLAELTGRAPEVRIASHSYQGLELKLLTFDERPVTARVGDAVRAGLHVRHRYGQELLVGLFVERLVCTNGMTRTAHPFGWGRSSEVGPEHQLAFLRETIPTVMESYGDLVARAQAMAEQRFSGSPGDALAERLRALRVPHRLLGNVIEAFEEEPGDTEWHLLNALTRYATHHADHDLSRRLQMVSGEWVGNWDVVTARLPRQVAQRVGAQIIEQINGSEGLEDGD